MPSSPSFGDRGSEESAALAATTSTVKLPRLLRRLVKGGVETDWLAGTAGWLGALGSLGFGK